MLSPLGQTPRVRYDRARVEEIMIRRSTTAFFPFPTPPLLLKSGHISLVRGPILPRGTLFALRSSTMETVCSCTRAYLDEVYERHSTLIKVSVQIR